MALFQQPVRPEGTVHAEFKAGRMEWDGRMVTADKRKGKIVLYTSEEEQLTHFQWHDREKNEVGLDLIVVNDAYMEKIEKCTTGRVYLLRFISSDKKLFFWMQEPNAEGDNDLIKKFNEAIGCKIPEKGAVAAPAPAGAAAAGGATGGAAGAAPTAETNAQLRALVQQFFENNQGGPGAAGRVPRTPPIPLTAVLTQDVLTSLLTDEAAVTEMMGLLPDSHKSPEGLREALTSPQMTATQGSLTQAIHSEQLPVLLASLGLQPGAISMADGSTDALEVLCQAMETQLRGSSPSGGAASGDANPSS